MTRFLGARRSLFKPPSSNPTILWTTNQITEIVSTSLPSASYTTNGGTSANGYGIFTNAIPSGDVYFDVTLAQGYSGYVAFLGISNSIIQFDYNNSTFYEAWYWSGSWFGSAGQVVAPPGALVADTYRIALRRSNGTFYIKGSTYGSSAVANLPTGSNLYLMNMTQAGFAFPNATILNGGSVFTGSGGLY